MSTNDEQVEKAARAWHEAACAAVPGWGAPWDDLAPVEREAAVGLMRAALGAVVQSEPGQVSAERASAAWSSCGLPMATGWWAQVERFLHLLGVTVTTPTDGGAR